LAENISYTDKELLRKVSGGDEQAFRELYQRYDALLYPFLRKLARSERDAQEIIQETFIKIWLSRDKLYEIEQPRAWIFRAAANTSHNWLKRNLVAQKAEQEHLLSVAGNTDTIELQLGARDLQQLLHRIIAEMPEQRRRIYLMHRQEGMKVSEIAAELQISVSTVKNTLSIAVKNIREKLGEAGYILSLLIFFIKK
jgi:RNA polymerase sigma-70 factor (family 1)